MLYCRGPAKALLQLVLPYGPVLLARTIKEMHAFRIEFAAKVTTRAKLGLGRRRLRLGTLVGSGVIFSVFFVSCFVAAEDWPRYGHDGALSGRSAARGSMTQPRVAWSVDLSGQELLVELRPAAGEHRPSPPAAQVDSSGSPRLTPAGAALLDLDGSGVPRPAPESFHERWAKILPDVPGLQRVAWNHTWTDQEVCQLQLFAYDQGHDQPRRVWESQPPEGVVFNPLNVVRDIDADGTLEICVAAHYRVMIFEGTTGRKETELRYHASRPYGWFGLADVDADGQSELVTIGDFQSHIDVLEFDAAQPEKDRLAVKWRRDIEQRIEDRTKWPQIGPHPVVDVTGDGKPEIVLNLFNDSGDGQWHVLVLDAATGDVRCDLPQRYLQGTTDIDACGAAELFVATTQGVLVHRCGTIELLDLRGRAPSVRWSCANAQWCVADLPCLGPDWSTTAAQGLRSIVVSSGTRPVFLVQKWYAVDNRQVSLTALRVGNDGAVFPQWEIGPFDSGVSVVPTESAADAEQAEFLVRVRLPAGTSFDPVGHDVRPRVQQNVSLGIDVSLPIAARLGPETGLSLAVEGPGEQLYVIGPPGTAGEAPTIRWQRPGRGMRDGSRNLGFVAADLEGDGNCEILVADRDRQGQSQLVAYRGDGSELWRKDFADTPGDLPVWNVASLTFWWPGFFRQPQAMDVFVNTRRGPMHSDVGHLLDGRDATTIWTREKAIVPGEFQWGWAGTPLATCDLNGDGRDELASLHPVCFWIADGREGAITTGKELASRKTLPAWAAYGEPLVHDFNQDGAPEILLDSPYILALLDRSGKPVWHGLGRQDFPVTPGAGNAGETTNCKHALADLDGDGVFEIASAGYGDGVRAIDPRTGTRLWSLAAPAPTCPRVTAANIDGQGGDEILYAAGTLLVAVTGDRSEGRILWTWQGPATLSMPAIADVDGDGLAEIIVQDATAKVHCLK